MRLAVFTSQFPSRVSTFFARDMRALLDAGIDMDIYPIYPLDPGLWPYVPAILSSDVLPRSKVHHVNLTKAFEVASQTRAHSVPRWLRDLLAVGWSAAGFGIGPVAKSAYAGLKGWLWANDGRVTYDHVLAYWGNYAATSAYHFHRLGNSTVPFSMFLHAGADLYRNQVYLRQKLLYADNIIVVCEFNRGFLRGLYGSVFPAIAKKIHVYHPGVDLSHYSYVPEGRSRRRVVAVGTFDRVKGFDDLIRAVHLLGRRGREVELDLIGDGKEAKALRRLARRLRISDLVRFRGWRGVEEVRLAIREAAILAHPSTGLGDAVPTVVKESMALGTPVVASGIAGIPELLDYGGCGVLVPPRNVEALANALERLLGDDDLRRQYADAARRFAERKFDLWRNGSWLAELLCSTRRVAA